MGEIRQILILTFLTIVIGVSGLVLVDRLPSLTEGDVAVDEYVATLYVNGTLVEDYVYNVKVSNQYRMLYRSWDASLSTKQLNRPYVQFISGSASDQMIFYVRDFQGSVWLEDRHRNDPYVYGTVKSLASLNEVGVFNPERFAAGRYKVHYSFQVYPPLECDESLCHVNLKLASEHLAYHDVTLVIKDPGYVVSIYTRPLLLKETRDGNDIVIHLIAAKDETLELEILLKRDVQDILKGFPSKFDNVKSLTVQANNRYLTQYYVAQGLRQGAVYSEGEDWRVLTTADGLLDNMVNVMLQDRHGGIWFGSQAAPRGGISYLRDGRWQLFSTSNGLPHNNINALFEDKDGNVWAGTGLLDRGGAVHFTFTETGWAIREVLTSQDGLAGNNVRSIFQARKGVFLFGSEYDGLALLEAGRWRVLTVGDGLSDPEVQCIVEDEDGTLWIGTANGITRLSAEALDDLQHSADE